MKIFVFGIPFIFFLTSPAIISDAMYRERYGNINKFVVHAHVAHDLKCCANPLLSLRAASVTRRHDSITTTSEMTH
jgi:hypothetical protein